MAGLLAASVATDLGRLGLAALAFWGFFSAGRVAAAIEGRKRRGHLLTYLPGDRWQETWTRWALRLFFGVLGIYLILVVLGVVADPDRPQGT